MAPRARISAKASLTPFLYYSVTIAEPLMAVLGAVQTLLDPSSYTHSLSDSAVYDPETTFLYTQLSGAWLMFAWIDAVVLSRYDDLELWKAIGWGMVLSDIATVFSSVQAMGGIAEFVQVANWRPVDWVVFAATAYPVGVRAAIMMGIGTTVVTKKDV